MLKKYRSPTNSRMHLRMTSHLKERLTYSANMNVRSLNAEAISILETHLYAERASGHVAKQSPDAFKSHSEGNHCDDAQ